MFIWIHWIFTFWINSPAGCLSLLDFHSSLCSCASKFSNCNRGKEERNNDKQQLKSFPPARRPLRLMPAVSLSTSCQLFQTCLRAQVLPYKVDRGRRLKRNREEWKGELVVATVHPNRWLCSSQKEGRPFREVQNVLKNAWVLVLSFLGFFFARCWYKKKRACWSKIRAHILFYNKHRRNPTFGAAMLCYIH